MKATCLALFLLASGVSAARVSDKQSGSAIANVIKKLKDMLKASQDDWKADKAKYVTFIKYCEDNTDKKTASIAKATTDIASYKNKIGMLQGSSGLLSINSADIKADKAENRQAMSDATALRSKEKKTYDAQKTDLDAGVGQMDLAIQTLSDVGADQTSAKSNDNKQFMAGFKGSLLSMQTTVREALVAANSLVEPEKRQQVTALLQGPFTGTYSSQAGPVVGILKNMRDTFKDNLASAKASELASISAYDKFKKIQDTAHAALVTSYDEKQASLGSNDGDLSTKKGQLQESTKSKGEDEDFLSSLTTQCKDKTALYNTRKVFATNEEIALNKALSILDNDVSAEKFGASGAGKAAFFLQFTSTPNRRSEASAFLQGQAQQSRRVRQVLLLLQAGNPFSVVLGQIEKMIKMADAEQKVDNEEKAWCTATNKANAGDLDGIKAKLQTTQKDITKLSTSIDDPAKGLKAQIKAAEDGLKDNLKNQGDQTKQRRDENLEYQKDVGNLQDVTDTIKQAKDVLTAYYNAEDNEQIGFIQMSVNADPDPPATFAGDYKGQNEQAKVVLGLLDGITKSTWTETTAEHDAELKGQQDYEDSMKKLTDQEAASEESIVKLGADLATAEATLESKFTEQTSQEVQKTKIERYIAKLKPGCDFVLNKYDSRKTSRAAEKTSLKGAVTKLKGSPAYKTAMAKADMAALGDCKDRCVADAAGAKCKACKAGVSVPGYCAGHAGTKGC